MRPLRTIPLATCILLGGVEAPSALDARERVVIVVRVGKLAEAEVSPSPLLKVPALWRLALEGISLTQLVRKPEQGSPQSLEELKKICLPLEAAVEAVDWRPSGPTGADTPPERKDLVDRFGAPPELTPDERSRVDALRSALGAPGLSGAGPAPTSTVTSEDLRWLSRSPVTLVRVPAAGGDGALAAERDELLEKIIVAAGPASNVIVVNLPERGAGTLIVRGPRLKKARVSEKPRTIQAVRGLVALLLDPTAGEKDPTIQEESIHELFK